MLIQTAQVPELLHVDCAEKFWNVTTTVHSIIRVLFCDIYWLSVPPEHFSAWLYVYHCSTMRCVICAN